MIRKTQIQILPLVLHMIMIAAFGCTEAKSVVDKTVDTTKSVVKKLRLDKPDLKKNVLMLPLIDLAKVGEKRAEAINTRLFELVTESEYLTLHHAPSDFPMPRRLKSPEFSLPIHPNVLKGAEDLGMNAVVSAVLNPIDVTTKKAGIWPFRDPSRIHEVSMIVNVVDISTRTFYLTNLESEKVPLPLEDLEGLEEKEILNMVLQEAIPPILKRQGSAITKGLEKGLWSGKIVSIEEDALMINAGKDLAVQPGQIFTVFARGETILTKGGAPLQVLGPKVGEIKVISVMENHSLAEPIRGGPFGVHQVIRFKD